MPKKPRDKKDINSSRVKPSNKPVWKGPHKDGVTQSLISQYLFCKERFRILTIDGLRAKSKLNIPIEFGQMWHIAEEYHANNEDWEEPVLDYAKELAKKHRTEQDQIQKWYSVCKTTFPIYAEFWKEQEDVKNRTPMYQEVSFKVPYSLPSKRTVLLRGKWDSVDDINGEIYLQENKTKSQVDVETLERQLKYDLQVMTYLAALRHELVPKGHAPPSGVRYNVIRRPLAGGKGSIRPHKATKNKPAETMDHYYERLGNIIRDNREEFFFRWKVNISEEEVNQYEHKTLIPILENILDDYEWWSFCKKEKQDPYNGNLRMHEFKKHCSRHFRLPYGIYNPIAQGRLGVMDEYLSTGSTISLENVDNLFPEL